MYSQIPYASEKKILEGEKKIMVVARLIPHVYVSLKVTTAFLTHHSYIKKTDLHIFHKHMEYTFWC
jgi:hypothetical protein